MALRTPSRAFAFAMVLLFNAMVLVGALPDLRIMPLGDSITKGSGSSGIIGYRGPLRQKLLDHANGDFSIDMVGSLTDARPNIVLIHAGTNNMDKNVDLDIALDIYRNIIDGIFKEVPGVTILAAPVIWANKPAMQANTNNFNPQIEALIKLRQTQGKRILAVPIDINVDDLSDLKHPNDKGYKKMADAWFKAILDADSRGFLEPPAKVTDSDAPGTGIGTGSSSGSGSSSGDLGKIGGGIWDKKGTIFPGFTTWESTGPIAAAAENGSRDKLILADLNGDGIADYVLADNDGTVRAWINGGKPNSWTSLGKVNPGWSSIKGDMIRMADVDNDGKADLIVLYSDGAAKVWKNTNNGKAFTALDANWATGLASRENVHFEDIDGDGYADYVIVYSGGSVKWARNTHNNGKDSSKKNWESAVTIAPGPAGIPANSARIRDLDGDGKADYLIVYDGGAVKALRNTIGSGGSSRNWDDIGTIAPGVSGVTGKMIRFADMDGDGLADFLAVADDGSIHLNGDGKDDIVSVDAKGRARAWINKGSSFDPIGEIAPGLDEDLSSARIEFADINGDSYDDYIVIYGGGAVKAYLNTQNILTSGSRNWENAITISPGVGEPGSKVRFADLNGDGYDDFLILYDGGAVKCWLNNKNVPPKNGERIWGEGEIVATGVGEAGRKVRFADLTGDGKADYIIQYDGGSAKAYRNNGKIGTSSKDRKWTLMGTIATGVSPQGPVRYADINGDGKADYLVAFGGGAVNAYVNSFDWKPKKTVDDDKNDDDKDDKDDKDKNPTCRAASKTHSDKQMPMGYYMDWDKIDSQSVSIEGWQYITIVNLTPHTFKYDSEGSHYYQMTNWDFGDIPPGKSRQNAVEYSSTAAIKLDSKGEAYYSIDGTKDKFLVRVTNHAGSTYPKRIVFDLTGMGAGSREYNCPKPETPVTLVITGSADYEDGYITSLVHGGAGWMQNIKSVIQDRTLDQIVMPGSHDAGMSTISGALLTIGGGWKNTQTQNLNINSQLWAGSRWFDLRIGTVHKPGGAYEFYALHVNDELWASPVGNSGEKFRDIVDEVNAFTSQFPGEVIILQFRYMIGIRESPAGGPIHWDDDIKDDFFGRLTDIENRCGGLEHEKRFHDYKLSTLMSKNAGKGCVLIFLDTEHLDENIEEEDQIWEKEGIYRKDAMSVRDPWPNRKDTKDAVEFTIDEWKKNTQSGMYVAQWLVTPFPILDYSIMEIAILPTNPALYWRGVNEITPQVFPNVLMVDYIANVLPARDNPDWDDLSAEIQVLAIGLNLYLISENCDISSIYPPLLPSKDGPGKLASHKSAWNGVVFANGTRLDKTPPGFRLGCSAILPKGTIFGNGTVLQHDVQNPSCAPPEGRPGSALPTFDIPSAATPTNTPINTPRALRWEA
ncbi:hypothetical protein DER45DRAFT_594703 [Fusarium avenaceum]|nr:hypothetical protein DER45DRAFT_594703 [Fusarium avenaceum]